MPVRLSIVMVIYFMAIAYNSGYLKKAGTKGKVTYAALMLISVYLGVLFILQKPWPNLNHAMDWVYSGLGEIIVNYLKPPLLTLLIDGSDL